MKKDNILVGLGKQLEDARLVANANTKYVTVALEDLISIQQDIELIKDLLYRGNTKFVELAIKTQTVNNKLGIITNINNNIEVR